MRAHAHDAGLDLHTLEAFSLAPGGSQLVRTGIRIALDTGYVGLIADRSSCAKRGIVTAGGVIDSGYRGEIGIILWNISQETHSFEAQDRVAQLLILPLATPVVVPASLDTDTVRGTGGVGSSGR